MKARYIDAEALKQRIMNNWYTSTEIIDDIDAEPTADVVERKVGKWTNDKGLYKCSECGELWTHWWAVIDPPERMYKMMRFCPNCGAEMENLRREDEEKE